MQNLVKLYEIKANIQIIATLHATYPVYHHNNRVTSCHEL